MKTVKSKRIRILAFTFLLDLLMGGPGSLSFASTESGVGITIKLAGIEGTVVVSDAIE